MRIDLVHILNRAWVIKGIAALDLVTVCDLLKISTLPLLVRALDLHIFTLCEIFKDLLILVLINQRLVLISAKQ